MDGKGFVYVFVIRNLSCWYVDLGPEDYIEQQEIAMRRNALKKQKKTKKHIKVIYHFLELCTILKMICTKKEKKKEDIYCIYVYILYL